MKHLVIGASLKPERTSFTAIHKLVQLGKEVVAIGLREGVVAGVEIQKGFPEFKEIDTVLLYINPDRQPAYADYIKSLSPRRVIFNPGTENPVFSSDLVEEGIEPVVACSLVLMATDQY